MARSSACPSSGRMNRPARPDRQVADRISSNHPSRPISHPATMSRSRPTIDVSDHLIEPDPSAPSAGRGRARRIDWAALFGNDHPVELEVGPGKGLFLANAATAHPGHNFLGVEISRKYARAGGRAAGEARAPNAKVWAGDVRDVLVHRVPDRSVRAVHVYFPDPWWKKRHKKRRVFTGALVAEIERVLQPGGELHVASDVEEYFELIRRADRREPRVPRAAGPGGEGPRARARLPDQLRAEVPPRRAADLRAHPMITGRRAASS